MNSQDRNKELDDAGFDTARSRRSLFYILFSVMLGIIILLARQNNIERKNTKAAEDAKSELEKQRYEDLYNLVKEELKQPKAEIKEAVKKIDSTTNRVRSVAEKLDSQTQK